MHEINVLDYACMRFESHNIIFYATNFESQNIILFGTEAVDI
jgi:hypothetical protein